MCMVFLFFGFGIFWCSVGYIDIVFGYDFYVRKMREVGSLVMRDSCSFGSFLCFECWSRGLRWGWRRSEGDVVEVLGGSSWEVI